MKKIIIALSLALVIILFIGFNYIQKSNYDDNEIDEVNRSIKAETDKLNITQKTDKSIDNPEDQINDIDEESPVIDILYPDKFSDGDTVITTKVQLVFSDNQEVSRVTMNNLSVDVNEVLINTEGTYHIVAYDKAGNEEKLSFTINFPQTKNTSTQKSNSNNTPVDNSTKNETPPVNEKEDIPEPIVEPEPETKEPEVIDVPIEEDEPTDETPSQENNDTQELEHTQP